MQAQKLAFLETSAHIYLYLQKPVYLGNIESCVFSPVLSCIFGIALSNLLHCRVQKLILPKSHPDDQSGSWSHKTWLFHTAILWQNCKKHLCTKQLVFFLLCLRNWHYFFDSCCKKERERSRKDFYLFMCLFIYLVLTIPFPISSTKVERPNTLLMKHISPS